MSTPARFTDAIHIGTGEFSFSKGATSRTDSIQKGFRDIGNVEVYQLQISNDTIEREGAYRGKKSVDASFSIKQQIAYMFRCDELTKDNLLLVMMGEDLGDNARAALVAQAADALDFSVADSDPAVWYDLCIAGQRQVNLTSVTVATLTEGTDFEVDLEAGRIRFLTTQSASRAPSLTGPAIAAGDDYYMKSITPLEQAQVSGYGRFMAFHAKTEKLTWDHQDFSCVITPANFGEQDGKKPSTFDFNVKITSDRGRMFAANATLNT